MRSLPIYQVSYFHIISSLTVLPFWSVLSSDLFLLPRSFIISVINENCPACFEEPKERARVKKLLSREETLYPNLYDHIRRALIPIMHDDSTAIMRSYLEETISKSVKLPNKGRKPAGDADTSREHLMETGVSNNVARNHETQPSSRETPLSLDLATEEQLIAELAKRRAAKYQLSGAMKRLTSGEDDDPTGQVCSLTGKRCFLILNS